MQLMNRLPGCVHISQDPNQKHLIYLYFKDEESRSDCLRLLQHDTQEYGDAPRLTLHGMNGLAQEKYRSQVVPQKTHSIYQTMHCLKLLTAI